MVSTASTAADHRSGGPHQGGLVILKFLVANSSFNVILPFVDTET